MDKEDLVLERNRGMYGWTGAVLHVDLTKGTHWVERPNAELYQKWIGGKALAAHYLAPSTTLSWNDPAMPIIWMTGPLTATQSPSSGHVAVMTRSPLTGTLGDTTLGGEWGTQLKRAGFDGLVVRGRASRPCGIAIQNGRVEIQDATGLVGLRTSELMAHLKPLGPFVSVVRRRPGGAVCQSGHGRTGDDRTQRVGAGAQRP
jgi:aldehyde:ferredoxin oxidoreductase